MAKIGSLLGVCIIILAICYPFIARDSSLYLKPIVAILLALAIIAFALVVWYKLIHINLKQKLADEYGRKYGQATSRQPVPYEIIFSMAVYNGIATKNYWMYRALGVVGLASSLFLAVAIGQEEIIPVYATKILAFVSSLSTGIIFSFNLVEKSNRARKAYRHILNAVLLYQHDEITMKELLANYSEAEN